MGKHHWKIEKQPEWYVKAVRKTIAALPGGYAEAADWLDVTEKRFIQPPSCRWRSDFSAGMGNGFTACWWHSLHC